MTASITFLGGVEEIGASSSYFYFDGTGIMIDCGLHPKKRNEEAFPRYELIKDKPADLLLITHSHTDHIGGMPYLMKFFPHIDIRITHGSRDIAEYMLKDTTKILKSEMKEYFEDEMLALYKKDVLQKINMVMKAVGYKHKFEYEGRRGRKPVGITFYPSGHILGSASILMQFDGKAILHTGDLGFHNQYVLPGADLPEHHLDALIIESTNAATKRDLSYKNERKKFADFINEIVNENGSILMPAFSLGKTQEMLTLLYRMMKKGDIPHLKIYTAGLGRKISKVYDKYCYKVPMIKKGWEISDVPQIQIRRDEIFNGKYFREPGIVLVSNGMMQRRTYSYQLATKWVNFKNFGIAFTGYQDPDAPGYAMEHSKKGEIFDFGGKKIKRNCKVAGFRFTSHAILEDTIEYIKKVKPKKVFIVHGDEEASLNLAKKLTNIIPATNISMPEIGREYILK